METIETSLFGDLAAPDSLDELNHLIDDPHPTWGRVRMWRGQPDVEWPIHTTGYRRLQSGKSEPTEKDMRRYEKNLMKHATHRGFRHVEGRRLTDWELLARLRHYGAATRLLDASRNAYIALWFAVDGHLDRVGLLLGVHSGFLAGYESEAEIKPYDTLLDGLESKKKLRTWEPTSVSPRIAAQHSQFLISPVVHAATGSVLIPDEDEESSLLIAIKPELKQIIRQWLIEVLDIRTVTLFPDLEGFSEANSVVVPLGEMYRW